MQRKIPVRSILFLSLIRIGLLLLLLAWWGSFYRFLLPAAVLGQADWGTGAWLAAELLLVRIGGLLRCPEPFAPAPANPDHPGPEQHQWQTSRQDKPQPYLCREVLHPQLSE